MLIVGCRGVHGSVQVGFVPNPKPTRWHRVSSKKTCYQPQTPTGQVGSMLFHRRLNRLKPTMMLPEIPFDGDLYFSPNLHRICAKITRSKQKNIKSSPDFCKTHEIWAKIHQIITGIFKKFAGIFKNPVDLHQKSPKSA